MDAFATCGVEGVVSMVGPEIRRQIVGDRVVEGIDAFRAHLESMPDERATELTLHTLVTHGRHGAANGTFRYADGSEYAFCDVYRFTNTKGAAIAEITSYGVMLGK